MGFCVIISVMKLKETIKTIWGTNRWYRRLSILIVSLIVAYILLFVFLSITGWMALASIVGGISTIFNLLIVLWLASTITVIYPFFHREEQYTYIEGLPKPMPSLESARSRGIIGYLLENNRWYVYFSVITVSLLVGLFISGMLIDGASSTMTRNEIRSSDFYQGISEFSSIFIPIWIIWTIKVVYYFKPEEMASVPAPITRVTRRFVLSLFAVVAILLFLFIIVMLFGASART